MRVTTKGQVTIPQAIRDRFGFLPETEVEFVEVDGVVTVVRADAAGGDRADRLVEALRGRATSGLTTEEILAMTRG